MSKPPLVIDWDGTLTETAWPQMGKWMPGAVDALHQLVKHAHVIVFTSRIAPMQPDGKTWRPPAHVQIEKNKIREMLDNENLYSVELWTKCWKPGAYAYIDDRGIRYTGRKGSWAALVPKLIFMAGNYEEAVAADEALELHG